MDPELISKKELLDETGISYGQLYRWKRKNLIPEEWFIRKSTFTGQETFFPRQKILARVQRIMAMKDERSLDEIAGELSPNPVLQVAPDNVLRQNIVASETMRFVLDQWPDAKSLSFEQVLYVYVLDKLVRDGDVSFMEGPMILQCLTEHFPKFRGQSCNLVFTRKLGVSTCLLTSSAGEVYFESGAKVVANVNIATCIEELNMHLVGLEG